MRRIVVSILLLAALVGLGIYCYNAGRAYDLIVDNHDMTLGEQTYSGARDLNVILNENEPLEMAAQDTMISTVAGRKHTITVEILNEDYEVVETVTRKFTLKDPKKIFLNIPAFLGKDEGWMMENPRN